MKISNLAPWHKGMKKNILNDLIGKKWLLFQKSWFIHNPPPRKKDVILHPAKYPETLVQEFIEFFTKKGQNVIDPMVGTGSTLVACIRSGRNGYGIELMPKYVKIAKQIIKKQQADLSYKKTIVKVIQGDARNIAQMALPKMDYCITSPPYWDMLNMKGAETQKKRKGNGLDVSYSKSKQDLGNISDYVQFVQELVNIYAGVSKVLKHNAYMTVIVKNVKKKGEMYPLAWDLGKEIGKFMSLKDEKIWCQDNQPLFPYAIGSAWVSNTFHHYCLNFRKE